MDKISNILGLYKLYNLTINLRNSSICEKGLAALTNLLDAENAMVEAQNNYTNAILEYKLAEIQFIKSKGELKTLTNK